MPPTDSMSPEKHTPGGWLGLLAEADEEQAVIEQTPVPVDAAPVTPEKMGQTSQEPVETKAAKTVESGPDLGNSNIDEPVRVQTEDDEEEAFLGEATLKKLRDGELVFDLENPGSDPKTTPDDNEDEAVAFNQSAREAYDSATHPGEPEPEKPAATSGSFSNEDVEQVIETPPPTPPQPPVAEATPEPEDKGPNSVDELLISKPERLLEQDYGGDTYPQMGGNILAREIVQRAINEGEVQGDIDQMPLPRIRQLAHEVYIAHRDAGFGRRQEEQQPTDVAVVAPEDQPEPAQPEAPVETPAAATPEPAHQTPYEPTDEELMRRFGLNEDELHEARLRWGSEKLKDEVVVVGESRKPVDPGTLEEWLIHEERDRITDQINRTTQPNNQPNNAIGFVGGENPDGPADNNPNVDEDEPIDGEIVGETLEEVIASRTPEFWRDLVGTYEGHGEPRPYTDAERERVKALLEAAGFYREGMFADEAFYAAQEVYFTFLCGDRILGAREYLVQGLLENLGNDQLEQRLNELRGRLEFLHLENMPPEMRARLETWLYLDILDNILPPEQEEEEEEAAGPDRGPAWERRLNNILRTVPEGKARQRRLDRLIDYLDQLEDRGEVIPDEFRDRLNAAIVANEAAMPGRRGAERGERDMTIEECRTYCLQKLVPLLGNARVPGDFNQATQDINRTIQEGSRRWTRQELQAFRIEMDALRELFTNLRASLYFQENPGSYGRNLGGPKEGSKPEDGQWIGATTYKPDNISRLFASPEADAGMRARVALVWQRLVVMGEHAVNPDFSDAPGTPPDRLLTRVEALYKNGVDNNTYATFTKELVDSMVGRDGISEYEAWIGVILFDAYHAAEYNKNHYLFAIAKPKQYVNNSKRIWWGSKWDYRRAAVEGDVRAARSRVEVDDNIFPVKLWEAPGVRIEELHRAVLGGQGVEVLLDLINPAEIQAENRLVKVAVKARDATELMNAVNKISPGTEVDKMDVLDLWTSVRAKIIGVTAPGGVDAVGDPIPPKVDQFLDSHQALEFLERVVRVYFLELSVYDEGASAGGGKGPRAQDPYELWNRFAVLANVRGGVGFFDLPGVLPAEAQRAFDETRAFVMEIAKGYMERPDYMAYARTKNGRVDEVQFAMKHFPVRPTEYNNLMEEKHQVLSSHDVLDAGVQTYARGADALGGAVNRRVGNRILRGILGLKDE